MLTVVPLVVGQMKANCYIAFDADTHDGIIIDPGDDAEYITDTILKLHVSPTEIIATHGHFDHIMAAFALKLTFRIPFCIHEADSFLVERMSSSAVHFLGVTHVDPAPSIDRNIAEGEILHVGKESLTVLHSPGHTPGSICLYQKSSGVLLTGDTIFADGGVGRTDHSYSSRDKLLLSLRKILSFPKETRLMPGHGQETTIGAEAIYHVQ